jgi:ATP-binding cassette subfamily B multidrug efflux pump
MSAARQSDLRLLARLLPTMRLDARWYGFALLCAPFSAALVVAQPWLLKRAIDQHIVPQDPIGLQQVALMYLGVVVLGFLLESAYAVSISYAGMRTIRHIRSQVYEHTLTRAQSFFDRTPTGRLLTRATSDVEALGETLTAGAITIVLDLMLVAGILIALFQLEPKMTATLLLVAPPLALAVEFIRRILRRLYLLVRTSLADLNAYLTERLQGLSVVQLNRDEARCLEQFERRNDVYRDATIRTNVWDALLFALVDGLASICMALMLWYGSSDWFDEVLTPGLLAAFIEYISRLFQPIREFSAKLAILQRAASAMEKIYDLLDNQEAISTGTQIPSPSPQTLTLHEVSFAYGAGPDVLKKVSISLKAGEVIAVVGRTGSGKTTLGKVLTRAYQGYRGSILLDGMELRNLDTSELRARIGIVQQDVHLFPGDVRFNLSLGQTMEDAHLQEILTMAHAQDTVQHLGGLDGHIAHDASNISVGEAQLISIARTMARGSPFLILDEATASVDTLTEARIQQATKALLAQRTVLVIAHRLSTIQHADRIVVLSGGEVVEMGTHHELMLAEGTYAALFQSQFEVLVPPVSAPTHSE